MAIAIMDAQLTMIQPSGHVNASNAVELQRQLATAITSAQHAVLVDMHRVESIDSAGLMALVSALSLAQSLKRRFSLCGIAPSIRIIFELTQLDGAFEIFESRDAFNATMKQSANTVASQELAVRSVDAVRLVA